MPGKALHSCSVGDLVSVPLPNGHYGLIWILLVKGANLTFFVMDGTWPQEPSETDSAQARTAPASGPLLPGRDDVWKGWINEALPEGFLVVGRRAPSRGDLACAEKASGTMIFGEAARLQKALLLQWRLANEPEVVKAEWARAAAERHERAARHAQSLTLSKMLREKPFKDWEDRWPRRAVQEARRIFRDATTELKALEQEGTKAQRTKVLKRVVTELNTLYRDTGCIETDEREQVVARIEQLAALAGLDNTNERLTGHRDW